MVLELLLFPPLNSGTVYLFLSAHVTTYVLLNPNLKLIFFKKTYYSMYVFAVHNME